MGNTESLRPVSHSDSVFFLLLSQFVFCSVRRLVTMTQCESLMQSHIVVIIKNQKHSCFDLNTHQQFNSLCCEIKRENKEKEH